MGFGITSGNGNVNSADAAIKELASPHVAAHPRWTARKLAHFLGTTDREKVAKAYDDVFAKTNHKYHETLATLARERQTGIKVGLGVGAAAAGAAATDLYMKDNAKKVSARGGAPAANAKPNAQSPQSQAKPSASSASSSGAPQRQQ